MSPNQLSTCQNEITKLLGENEGVNLHNSGLDNVFLGMTPNAQAIEKNRKIGLTQN